MVYVGLEHTMVSLPKIIQVIRHFVDLDVAIPMHKIFQTILMPKYSYDDKVLSSIAEEPAFSTGY